MSELPRTPDLTPTRYREFASHDPAVLAELLGSTVVAHVAFIRDDKPMSLPTAFGFDDDYLYLHGSTGSRLGRDMADGRPLSISIATVDGYVYARTGYDSAVLYRSAVIFGSAEVCEGASKMDALRTITEHLLPGRWSELPEPTAKEMAATLVLRVPLDTVSVKILDGADGDSDDDGPDSHDGQRGFDKWAGVVPVTVVASDPVASPLTEPGVAKPASLRLQAERFS